MRREQQERGLHKDETIRERDYTEKRSCREGIYTERRHIHKRDYTERKLNEEVITWGRDHTGM